MIRHWPGPVGLVHTESARFWGGHGAHQIRLEADILFSNVICYSDMSGVKQKLTSRNATNSRKVYFRHLCVSLLGLYLLALLSPSIAFWIMGHSMSTGAAEIGTPCDFAKTWYAWWLLGETFQGERILSYALGLQRYKPLNFCLLSKIGHVMQA